LSSSSAKVVFESTGSLLERSMPVGPIEPATKRGLSGVEYLSHAARASRAAATLTSRVFSSIPHSQSRCGVDWKVQVSTTSQPTARKDSWIDWMMSGRGNTRWSLHRSSDLPPKSSGVGWCNWMFVPIAPSNTRTRSAIAWRYRLGEVEGEEDVGDVVISGTDTKKKGPQRKRPGRRFSGMFYVAASCLKSPRYEVVESSLSPGASPGNRGPAPNASDPDGASRRLLDRRVLGGAFVRRTARSAGALANILYQRHQPVSLQRQR